MVKSIAFCGIDGSGKSTALEFTSDYLKRHGVTFKVIKSLDSSKEKIKKIIDIKERIGDDIYCHLLTYERFWNIKQSYEKYKNIDCILFDRYIYSDFAYGLHFGQDGVFVRQMIEELPSPDITFLFITNVSLAMERIVNRNKPILEFQEKEDVLRDVQKNFLSISSDYKFKVIENNGRLSEYLEICKKEIDKIFGF